MPQRCTVCAHPKRKAIDRLLVDRANSVRRIATDHRLAPSAVRRHRTHHLPAALARAQHIRDMIDRDDLAGQVRALVEQGWAILGEARASKQHTVALSAIDKLTRTLELLGKLLHELPTGPTLNLTLSAQWLDLRGAIFRALEPFPAARVALADTLETYDRPIADNSASALR